MNTFIVILSSVVILHKIWSVYNTKSSQMSASIAQSYLPTKTRERSFSAPHAAKTVKDVFELGSIVTELDTYLRTSLDQN